MFACNWVEVLYLDCLQFYLQFAKTGQVSALQPFRPQIMIRSQDIWLLLHKQCQPMTMSADSEELLELGELLIAMGHQLNSSLPVEHSSHQHLGFSA